MKTLLVAASAAVFLTACGGGSSGSGSGGSNASFSSMANRGEALIEKIDTMNVTPSNSMPTAGTATYKGVAGFAASEYDEIEVISEASLTANFSRSTIAGNLTNFRDYENTAIPGTVSLQSGKIRGNEFGADLNGQVTIDGKKAAVNGDMYGGFAGSKANMMAGFIEGTVGGQRVVGVIGAEKQ